MMGTSNGFIKFWQELKRRKVVRVITVYAAAAFVILELVDILAPSLGLPDWTLNLVLILLCVGFIIAVILSWIYDIHPEGGIVKTEPAEKVTEEDKPVSSKSWKIASYISFVVIVALIVLNIIPRTNRSDIKEILDKSIAVLPFINDSPEEENAYFINGIMEEILISLQVIKDFRVPGRTSVEQYRNPTKSIPEIASEMNVAYIVEGSGQRYGNKIRLRVQLVEGATDKHIWADSYDEVINEPEDIFRIQSQIAKSIANELQAIITPEEKQLIEKVPTTSLTAYDFYQRGREEYEDYLQGIAGREALERAENLYHKALDYDSTFALAYTGLAWIYRNENYRETYFNENFLDSVLILADIALSFDDQLSDAYVVKGWYYQEHNKKEQAINEFDKAIKLNPNDWWAYYGKGGLYADENDYKNAIENRHKAASLYRGPFLPRIYKSLAYYFLSIGFRETCEKYVKEALALDNDSASYYFVLAMSESDHGNFKKSIEFFERSIAIDSTDWDDYFMIGNNYIYLGQFEEALTYYQKAKNVQLNRDIFEPLSLGAMLRLGQTYLNIGKKEEAAYHLNRARELINEVDDLDRKPLYTEITQIYSRALLYTCLGDKDKAFEYLRFFYQTQYVPVWLVIQFKVEPAFNSIRDEPEFQQIVRDVETKYQAEHERVRQWLEENDML